MFNNFNWCFNNYDSDSDFETKQRFSTHFKTGTNISLSDWNRIIEWTRLEIAVIYQVGKADEEETYST